MTYDFNKLKRTQEKRNKLIEKRYNRKATPVNGLNIDTRVDKASYNGYVKISIIIVCYNYGRFLSTAIDSALNQTYDNIEVVVINDGSIDETHDVARRYENKILYINQPHCGVAISRNNAVKQSSGNWIVCFDADDYYHPQYLEEAVKLIENEKTIVCPLAYFTDENLNPTGVIHPANPDSELCKFENLIKANNLVGSSLYSKSQWEKVGGYKPLVYGEDYELWVNMVKHGSTIKYLISDIKYYLYRRHSNNATKSHNFKKESINKCIENIYTSK